MRCTLLANGITGEIDRDDAETVAEFLLLLGKAVHPSRWVDVLVERVKEASLESVY